jgi:hypothetical protein
VIETVRWYDDMIIMKNKADNKNNNNYNYYNSSFDIELLSSLPLWNEELAAEFAAAEKRKMMMLQKEKKQSYKAQKIDLCFEIK